MHAFYFKLRRQLTVIRFKPSLASSFIILLTRIDFCLGFEFRVLIVQVQTGPMRKCALHFLNNVFQSLHA